MEKKLLSYVNTRNERNIGIRNKLEIHQLKEMRKKECERGAEMR